MAEKKKVERVKCCGTCRFGVLMLWKFPEPEVMCKAGVRVPFDDKLTIYCLCGEGMWAVKEEDAIH